MPDLYVYVDAPFAAFRTFTAGWYRPTAAFLTPSAAYGLLLNAAGIESRLREEEEDHDGKTPASLMKPGRSDPSDRVGLPDIEIAVGAPTFRLSGRSRWDDVPEGDLFPRVQSVFQQLHNYPVGKGNKVDDPDNPGEKVYQGDLAERRVKGNKSNITPVRREFLSDVRAVIAVKTDADTEDRIRRGLGADPPDLDGRRRYGVPFLGDNAFLPDRLEELSAPGPVRWYERITADSPGGLRDRATRLTVLIDRADLSRTTSHLYAPGAPALQPPETAWTLISPPTRQQVPRAPRRRKT
jgi:CRISPR-associated protein Cas5t